MNTPIPQYLLDTWLEIGQSVRWMELAVDPPFSRSSFVHCQSSGELITHLLSTDHPLGRAFTYGDVCFLNLGLLPPTDEWLVVKGRTTVGTVSFQVEDASGVPDAAATRRRIMRVVDLLERCSEAECAEPDFGGRF